MLGKVFWGMVILLFIAILAIPFILPSYYADQAEEQQYYSENYEDDADGGNDIDIDFNKRRKKKSFIGKFFTKSVRSSGGSRSFSSGK